MMRELDLRQPALETSSGVGTGSKGDGGSISPSSSSMPVCPLKAASMVGGSGVEEPDDREEGGGVRSRKGTTDKGGRMGLDAMIDHETALEQSAVSLLQHTPLVRRMRYRGDVRIVARAMLSAPSLSRLLALDITECNLTPLSAQSLAAAFAAGACPRLGHLDCSDNSELGEEGAQAIGKAIEMGALPQLQGLLLFGNKIQGGGGRAIARAIASGALPRLEILDLSGNSLGTAATMELAKALESSQCPRLEQLGMSDNEVEEEGIEALATALGARALAGCAKLEKLHLGGNHCGPRAAKKLGEALQQNGCGSRMVLLELHSARLGGEGIRVIAEVLRSGACDSLREVWLDDNTEGEEDGEAVLDIMDVLASGSLPVLEALGLNWTGLGSEGAAALAAALMAYPRPGLHRLDLRSTSITGPGLVPLADALCKQVCSSLRWLDLSGNALFAHGARELARALEGGAGKSLRRLDLHAVGLETEGVREIARVLKQHACPELMGLGLALNRIGHRGAEELSEAMVGGGLAKLVGLELHKNELGDAGVKVMTTVLAEGACPLLMYLGMSVNRVGDAGALALVERIREGKGLARLERLNLQDNAIGQSGLKALHETAVWMTARGWRLRLEVSGNGERQTIRRKPGWLRKGKRTFVGLTVGGGGAIVGALAVKLGVLHGSHLTPAILSLAVVGLGIGGMAVGMAQCGGLVRAWGRGGGAEQHAEGGPPAAVAAAVQAAGVTQAPLSIILAVVAGDVAVTATGLGVGWVDLVMLCMWTLGLLAGFMLVLQRTR